ncbi:hypothetical protein D8Y22_07425 [Salinadaptatus halalkaliphilus]|uniref:Uncharacterized protein n=1 Tax=Salinadaptatus halalkaliphilus TaxID=2419781 RepID=A0A4S3TLJ9_9EURY|nr:hypothetical protein [Salinadaptatus halalkaliphilus]THE65049.1 hypothetical protein D8Y22_07425 [Salinadaptatus halalkaliphilus]
MTTHRRMQFVYGQLAWMLGTVLVLTVLGSVSLELFVSCSLIGVLVLSELTVPLNVAPAWRRRLPWLIALGLAGFGLLVVRRLLLIFPPEVLPW